jgi:hypothetical protein
MMTAFQVDLFGKCWSGAMLSQYGHEVVEVFVMREEEHMM